MSDAVEIATLAPNYRWPVAAAELPYPISFPPTPEPQWRDQCSRTLSFNTVDEGWQLFESAALKSLQPAWARHLSSWLWVLNGAHLDDISAAFNAAPTAAARAVINEYRGRAFGWGWAMTGRALDEIRDAVLDYLKATQPQEIVVVRFFEWGKY